MSRVPIEVSAGERAHWLAELAKALDEAERLVWSLGNYAGAGAEIMELYGWLDAARAEVQALRFKRGASIGRNPEPYWTDLLPWERREVNREG